MVSLPKLSNCCACISLKTGTLIIGALNLVGSVICIIASIGTMAMAGLKVGAFDIISRKYQKTKWVGGSAEENGNFPFLLNFCHFQALVDVVEQSLDQHMPWWRNDFDRKDISSGSILPTHDTQLTICSGRLFKKFSGMKRLNLRNLYPWLWHAGRLNYRHSDFRLPCPWSQNGEDVFHSLLFSE